MKGWLLLVLIALAACTAGAAKACPSSTASPATTPSPSPVAAACRLPISLGSTSNFQGGFLSYPSGEVTVDPYLYSEAAGFGKISGQAGYPAGSCQ